MCVYVCVYVHGHFHVRLSMSLSVSMPGLLLWPRAYTYVRIHIYIYIHICISICMRIYRCICLLGSSFDHSFLRVLVVALILCRSCLFLGFDQFALFLAGSCSCWLCPPWINHLRFCISSLLLHGGLSCQAHSQIHLVMLVRQERNHILKRWWDALKLNKIVPPQTEAWWQDGEGPCAMLT